jgi:hypothetical protein
MDEAKAKAFLDQYPTLGAFLAAIYSKAEDAHHNKVAVNAAHALGELVGENLDGIPTLLQLDKSPVAAAQELHLQKAYEWVVSRSSLRRRG